MQSETQVETLRKLNKMRINVGEMNNNIDQKLNPKLKLMII